MKVLLAALLGTFLAAPLAHGHGNHDHQKEQQTISNINDNGVVITLYRDKSCHCCTKWGEHMAGAGYRVMDQVSDNMTSLKTIEGISSNVASCHTAFVNGYFIEGHVPAESVERLLRDLPDISGLAVPGMPHGSPGMEDPMTKSDNYEVFAVDINGNISVYDSYRGQDRM